MKRLLPLEHAPDPGPAGLRGALGLTLALLAGGCATEAPPEGVQLLVPADVEFSWKIAYDDLDDGLAAIVPLDVMVYDALTGEAIVGAEVELSSEIADFVPAARVEPGEPWCDACLWDAYRDEYVDLPYGAREVPMMVETDATGLVRVYAVVDAVGEGSDGFEPIRIDVRTEDVEQHLFLLPR